jgi:hypothetical protein
MIELEIYWPYPMVYKSLRLPLDGANLIKTTSNGRDMLNPLASQYVVLYTAPRHLVAQTVWWTSYPKNEAIIANDTKSVMEEMLKNSDIEEVSLVDCQHKGVSRQHSLRSQYKGISRQHSFMDSSKYISTEFSNGGKDNVLGNVFNFVAGESELQESRKNKQPSFLGSMFLGFGQEDVRNLRTKRRSSTVSVLIQPPHQSSNWPTKKNDDIENAHLLASPHFNNRHNEDIKKSTISISCMSVPQNEEIMQNRRRSTTDGLIQTPHQFSPGITKKNYEIVETDILGKPLYKNQNNEHIKKSSIPIYGRPDEEIKIPVNILRRGSSRPAELTPPRIVSRLDLLGKCISFDLRQSNFAELSQNNEDMRKSNFSMGSNSGKKRPNGDNILVNRMSTSVGPILTIFH